MPCSEALRTASSAAIWAANGVDLREPLNPMVPAEDHEMVLPWASVIVIIVLLNVEATWATPETIFLRSRRRTRVASFAMRLSFDRAAKGAHFLKWVKTKRRSLLLAGDGLRLALAGAGVGVGALAAHRQLLAMAQTPIGAQVHQALDVDRDFAAKVAFHHVVAVDRFADLHHFGVRQLGDAPLGRDMHLLDDLFGLLRPDSVDVLERDDHALVGGNIDACYASHSPKRSISAAVRPMSRAPRDCQSRRPVEAGPCRESAKTQKVPRARKRRRDPERLRDGADVVLCRRMSSEIATVK